MNFNERVWNALEKIPRGKVSTYKEVAVAVGSPNAFRAVGNACNLNPDAPKTPCHRVVSSNGSLGGYAKGLNEKERLLRKEGIKFKNSKILNFKEKLAKAKELK